MRTDKFFSKEAEIEVLGAILLKNESILEIYDLLRPEDFYYASHSVIYIAMKKLFEEGKPIEVLTIYEELGSKAPEVGGLTYLSELSNTSSTSHNIVAYGDMVKEKSQNRQVYGKLSVAIQGLREGDEQAEEILDKLRELAFSEDYNKTSGGDIGEGLSNYVDYLEKVYKSGGGITGITTGITNLDNITGGFNPQDYMIIAGRPSMGKSAVALNLALRSAIKGQTKVAIFSLEMNKNQCIGRLVSAMSYIPLKKIQSGDITDEEWMKFMEASNKISKLSISVYDDVVTLSSIIKESKKLKLQKGLDVIIIDYIQNIQGDGREENRTRELGKISRTLKLLAKELNITIVALSQLSRAAETRLNHRPIMADLRESGSLEQDADIVIGVYRDEYYNKDSEDKDRLELIVLKNRNGDIGTLKYVWDRERQRIG